MKVKRSAFAKVVFPEPSCHGASLVPPSRVLWWSRDAARRTCGTVACPANSRRRKLGSGTPAVRPSHQVQACCPSARSGSVRTGGS